MRQSINFKCDLKLNLNLKIDRPITNYFENLSLKSSETFVLNFRDRYRTRLPSDYCPLVVGGEPADRRSGPDGAPRGFPAGLLVRNLSPARRVATQCPVPA